MAIRFFIAWMLVTACVFGFIYFTGRAEKRIFRNWAKRFVWSLMISAILLVIMMIINNFSGV